MLDKQSVLTKKKRTPAAAFICDKNARIIWIFMTHGEEDEPQLQTEKQIVNLSSNMRKFILFRNFLGFFHSRVSGVNYLFWFELSEGCISGVDRYQDALKHLPRDSGKWGQVHVQCCEYIWYYFCTLSTSVFLSNCLASMYIYRLSLVPVATSLASLMQWRVLSKSANLHTKGPQMYSPPLPVSSSATVAPAVAVLCSQQALAYDHTWWGVGLHGGAPERSRKSTRVGRDLNSDADISPPVVHRATQKAGVLRCVQMICIPNCTFLLP